MCQHPGIEPGLGPSALIPIKVASTSVLVFLVTLHMIFYVCAFRDEYHGRLVYPGRDALYWKFLLHFFLSCHSMNNAINFVYISQNISQ